MNMTEKQKLMELIQPYNVSVEDALFLYMNTYPKEFPASRINSLIKKLQEVYLIDRIDQLEHVRAVAWERATYLEAYLEGKMYVNEETAKRHAPVQLKNAKAIIKACNGEEEVVGIFYCLF